MCCLIKTHEVQLGTIFVRTLAGQYNWQIVHPNTTFMVDWALTFKYICISLIYQHEQMHIYWLANVPFTF